MDNGGEIGRIGRGRRKLVGAQQLVSTHQVGASSALLGDELGSHIAPISIAIINCGRRKPGGQLVWTQQITGEW